jgi:hypothetical protein
MKTVALRAASMGLRADDVFESAGGAALGAALLCGAPTPEGRSTKVTLRLTTVGALRDRMTATTTAAVITTAITTAPAPRPEWDGSSRDPLDESARRGTGAACSLAK